MFHTNKAKNVQTSACITRYTYSAIPKIDEEIERVSSIVIGAAAKNQEILESLGSTPLMCGVLLSDLICRPELDYEKLAPLDPERPDLPYDVREQVNINIKYDGYITRQEKQVAEFKRLEKRLIPADIDYDDVPSLRLEARQKLSKLKPVSIGQASRISGVSPADISVLIVYLNSIGK